MDSSAVQPPKPPLHTSHSCKIPQEHQLHVDTSLEAKIFFFKIWSILGGTVPLTVRLTERSERGKGYISSGCRKETGMYSYEKHKIAWMQSMEM